MEIILSPSPQTTATDISPVRSILGLCRRALFEPTRFFRYDLSSMSVSEALAFGIGNAWAASVLAFFVQTFNTLLTSQLLERWMQKMLSSEEGFDVWGLSATSFLYTSGALLLAPFLFLLRSVLTTVWLYGVSRVLVEEGRGQIEPVTFNNCLRIEAASLTGHWFSVVPIFGGLLSLIVTFVLTVTGVRERFGVSTRRAFAIVIAPYFVLLGLVLLLGVVLIFGATQLPLDELLDLDGLGAALRTSLIH